jgi:predicted ArsR family transcriptional regulator
LLALLGTFTTPPLADVLARALAEVRQAGAAGATLDEQVEAVRRAVMTHGCRSVDEVIEQTGLSRWAVGRALERLVAHRVVEPRDRYLLADEAAEAGRPVVEYHPAAYPRGEGFSRLFRAAAEVEEGDLP